MFKRRLKIGPNLYLTVECTEYAIKEFSSIFPDINIDKIESWGFGVNSFRAALGGTVECLNPSIQYSDYYFGYYLYDWINKKIVFMPVLRFPECKKYYDTIYINAILNDVVINFKEKKNE